MTIWQQNYRRHRWPLWMAGRCPTARNASARYTSHRAIDKAQTRLHGLSKYTRKPTRDRLLVRLIERQVFVEEEINKLAQMVF
jgi:hypothetical protein